MAQGRVIVFGDFTAEETQEVLAVSHVALPQVEPKVAKPFSWGNLAKPQTASGPSRPQPPPPTSVNAPVVSLEAAFEEALTELNLQESTRDLQRRGFVNQGNTCFQNVTFQALLACPPFRNLLCLLSSKVGDIPLTAPPLVGWKHLLHLIRELDEPTLAQQMAMKQQHKKTAAPVILSPHFLRLFQSANGMQQDALEFLEFLLEHLHVDFEASPCTFPLTAPSPDAAAPQDGWAEIKKHGKASLVHHNVVENSSPITFLFKGTLRSELIRAGRKVGAATIEPFHCLHLTTPTLTATLSQMIHATMADEVLEQYTLKRTTFETLPVVLSLHVKRFTYDPVQGPLKLNTVVQYPVELDLAPSLFSPTLLLHTKSAKYKLFSVISHHGQHAVGGHYTAVCCDAKDQWSLYDDDAVQYVTKQAALAEHAYLLFYLRVTP